MRIYKLKRIGQLLFATGAVKGKDAIATFIVLVDTGSTYTILPWERLLAIGFEPAFAAGNVKIVTASGIVIAPVFKVEWLSCCGLLLPSFPVVAHTLPAEMSRFGILGMDFLRQAKAHIDVFNAQVEVEQ
ncbi:MAG: retropepsin-like domain-containing protein [candidate division KSB1 bacterium]|nr:retropepsin-like domain-containing protein [candidate division KSB1 bacterium]MDZ7304905.1 retropepsin-like domain-containing protein [candidate division KSB1 bacterium]MDZ7313959.1 retropepsin-like domain-containing protein [candidate division KSB1 bacterium]